MCQNYWNKIKSIEHERTCIMQDVPEHLKSNFMYIATKELIEKKLDILVRRLLPFKQILQYKCERHGHSR